MSEHHPRLRSRSRSPYRSDSRYEVSHHRERSSVHAPRPQRHHREHPHASARTPTRTKALPYNAADLSRHQLGEYTPLFALYLDVQKQILLEDLEEKELKGRWKSFVGKWNRGELAEGWYDRKTLERAQEHASERPDAPAEGRSQKTVKPLNNRAPRAGEERDDESEPSDDDYGPALPDSHRHHSYSPLDDNPTTSMHGPGATIPSLSDLRDRDEQLTSDTMLARSHELSTLRHERQLDRKQQKERLDELAPRAAAGTRERQLEKRREKADANRAFAAAKDAGADVVELRDSEVMGDEDSLGDLKRMKRETERKKNERELRKEEILRARRAEREERVQAARAREEKTMSLFKEIARQRFGGGDENESEGGWGRDST